METSVQGVFAPGDGADGDAGQETGDVGPAEIGRRAPVILRHQHVFRLAKVTPISGISASKNDPLSLRL